MPGRHLRYLATACWLATALVLWIGVITLCPGGECRVPYFDHSLLQALHATQNPQLTLLLSTTTWLGSIAVLLPAALMIAWFLRHRAHAATSILPIAVTGACLMSYAVKALASRPRPDLFPHLIALPAYSSFPSAHTLQITLQSADLKERASKMGAEPMPMRPAEFDAYIRNEIATNAALVKVAGIKVN